MRHPSEEQLARLHSHAYEAMDNGALKEASAAFARLLNHWPDNCNYHYMRGLAHKYLRDWPVSLQHNLKAIKLADDAAEAAHWNAAIAATAMREWSQVRQLWHGCGIKIPDGKGPIEQDFGVAIVRINPWSQGETVFARRIDPVRARLINIPLPESGHRFGDIVLHDGASTGRRIYGDQNFLVFNELQRLSASDFQTFVVFIACPSADDLRELQEIQTPDIACLEDWTTTLTYYCMRCSYGVTHREDNVMESGDWKIDRHIGIAALNQHAVEVLLEQWAAKAEGRAIDGIETRQSSVPAYQCDSPWWVGTEQEESSK